MREQQECIRLSIYKCPCFKPRQANSINELFVTLKLFSDRQLDALIVFAMEVLS